MNPLLVWAIAYVLPALSADIFVILFPQRRTPVHYWDAEVMHVALGISVLASQYAIFLMGEAFPWQINASVLLYAASVIVAFLLIQKLGLWYALSALIQELTMLSIAYYLFAFFPLYVAILLIVPVFVLSHPLTGRHWILRPALFSLWGIASVSIFYLIHNVWVIAAFHAVLGTVLIKQGVLYPRHKSLKRHV
jgi:hypothetical protein